MRLDVVRNADQLAPLREEWGQLSAPSPMQSHPWLATWWEVYGGASRELFTVTAREGDHLVGVAPWYRDRRGALRMLGDGRVCSDHATLLAAPGYAAAFTSRLAAWLLQKPSSAWRRLSLESLDADDVACGGFVSQATAGGCLQSNRQEPGACHIDLPATWDEYLAGVSKNHRKRCRRWTREFFDTGRAEVRVAEQPEACLAALDTLAKLHGSRRDALGDEGVFADPRFARFHRRVVPRLAAVGGVQLRTLYVDGQAVAAEYLLQDAQTWYAYQSGLSPQGEALSAGNLSILAMLRDVIACGCRRFDLLRGDEPYKFSWGAVHTPAATVTLRRPTLAGRVGVLRDAARQAARRVRQAPERVSLG